MVTLAYLGHRLEGQLAGNPDGLAGVEVAWQGIDVADLLSFCVTKSPSVLVVEMERLGERPAEELDRLRDRCKPELTLVLHHFAKRDLLGSLLNGHTRTLQAPVSLSSLRSQMLSLIVRDMLAPKNLPEGLPTGSTYSPPSSTPHCPQCGALLAG